MKSILRCLSVALLAASCNSDSSQPQIARIEPSIVTTAGLPHPISIVGANLRPAVALSLNDRAPLEVSGLEVHLNGIPAPILEQPDSSRLRVMLPKTLTMGTYDVTITLGPSHSVVLAGALRVMSDAPVTSDHSSSTSGDASPTASTSGASTDLEPSDEPTTSSASQDSELSSNSSITSDTSITTDGSGSQSTRITEDSSSTSQGDTSADEPSTGPLPSPSFRCAPDEFGPPEKVTIQGNYGPWIWSPALSQDGKVMFFTDSASTELLMVATRTQRTAFFSGATPAVSPRPQGDVGTPFLSQSELSLYFHSTHNGPASRELYVATRPSLVDAFSNAKLLRGLNGPNMDHLPWVSPDELTIVYVSSRNGTAYLTSTRPTIDDDFSPPVAFNLPGTGRIFITANGLRAYFVARDRPDGHGSDDIWFATRESTSDEFSNVTNLHVVNSAASDTDVTLSADGEELFFIRSEPGANTLYRSVASCD